VAVVTITIFPDVVPVAVLLAVVVVPLRVVVLVAVLLSVVVVPVPVTVLLSVLVVLLLLVVVLLSVVVVLLLVVVGHAHNALLLSYHVGNCGCCSAQTLQNISAT